MLFRSYASGLLQCCREIGNLRVICVLRRAEEATPANGQHHNGPTWKFIITIIFHHEEALMSDASAYWKANIRLVAICLVIWFIVSFLFGIILVDALNTIQLGGYKLGFWFAQQGSIYTFVVLIFFYAWRMGQLDRKFNVHED
jgi:putative solute:sodium symporter small subunit